MPGPISTWAGPRAAAGEDHDALACYETAVRLQPDDAEIQRRLGDLLVLKKDWPAALAALERAVALEPDDPAPFARLCSPGSRSATGGPIDADLERLWADAEGQLAAGEPPPSCRSRR